MIKVVFSCLSEGHWDLMNALSFLLLSGNPPAKNAMRPAYRPALLTPFVAATMTV